MGADDELALGLRAAASGSAARRAPDRLRGAGSPRSSLLSVRSRRPRRFAYPTASDSRHRHRDASVHEPGAIDLAVVLLARLAAGHGGQQRARRARRRARARRRSRARCRRPAGPAGRAARARCTRRRGARRRPRARPSRSGRSATRRCPGGRRRSATSGRRRSRRRSTRWRARRAARSRLRCRSPATLPTVSSADRSVRPTAAPAAASRPTSSAPRPTATSQPKNAAPQLIAAELLALARTHGAHVLARIGRGGAVGVRDGTVGDGRRAVARRYA